MKWKQRQQEEQNELKEFEQLELELKKVGAKATMEPVREVGRPKSETVTANLNEE